MKIKRQGAALGGLVVASALVLTACGSDNNSATGGAGGSSAPSGPAVDCGTKNLAAEGSTAQKNAMDQFVQKYTQKCAGQQVAYNGTGSGAGVKQFNGGQVDFAGSDSALDPTKGETDAAAKRCGGNPAFNLPMVFGPIAVSYKLDGVTDLTLNGEVTAKIFSGEIKKWNDPAIKALNASANLPDKDITVVYRSDQSGTTDNFQKYLKDASKGAWTKGAGKGFNGGVGEGKQGTAGVAQAIAQADGTIGYVEWSFAQDQKLAMAKIDSGSGAVALSADTAGKAVEAAKVKGTNNDLTLDLDALYSGNTAGAYPILLATYEIVCSKGYDPATAKAVKAFLTVSATDGQQGLADAGYVPVPKAFQDKLLTSINAIS